jgi:predicted amidophosphoribosyltransferase
MVDVHPMRIPGRWIEGYVLDYHTVSSSYVGDDEFGNPRFETKRTEMGELLYRFKYQEDNSVLGEIIDELSSFFKLRNLRISMIIPTPPSRERIRQPVFILASD